MPRIAPLLLLLSTATAACGERFAEYAPEVRAATADLCVIGTVIEFDDEPVQAKPYPGAADPASYTVAVVKVEMNIHGAKNITHVRVGFIPPQPNIKRGYDLPLLEVDQKLCLFLNQHLDAAITTMPVTSPPIEVNDASKEIVARIRQMATVYADPLKALKADKAEDRTFAAGSLLYRYLQRRTSYIPTTTEAIPAEETKAILAVLADADWTAGGVFAVPLLVQQVGLTSAQGFRPIQPKPGQDANHLLRDEFKRWVADEGAKYTLKRIVPKAK